MQPEPCDVNNGGGIERSAPSLPRGGPIYVPDMVGSLTRVPDFEFSLLRELQDLKEEIGQELDEIDISVDELKIITDEELVEKALEVAFKDDNVSKNSSKVSEEQSDARIDDDKISSSKNSYNSHRLKRGTDTALPNDSGNGFSHSNSDGDASNTAKTRKRSRHGNKNDDTLDSTCPSGAKMSKGMLTRRKRRRNTQDDDALDPSCPGDAEVSNTMKSRKTSCDSLDDLEASRSRCSDEDNDTLDLTYITNSKTSDGKKAKTRMRRKHQDILDESYMLEVEKFVKIKQKRDEEKATVKLHCFNGSSSINKSETKSSEITERIKALRSNTSTRKVREQGTHDRVQVLYPEKEIILCVEVYHSRNTWVKTQEFLVLGRQPLSELRDKICCVTDQVMEKAGMHDPSGYFLIEDVFCNDLREASAIDYSKPILDWLRNSKKEALEKWEQIVTGKLKPKQKELVASKSKPNLPQFKSFQMHKIRFCDLHFRLGAGYLYCHQGDCKHVITIRDMRLIHPEDAQNRFDYPLETFRLKSRLRKCSVCQIFRAEKVTVEDKWAGENPCYFCGLCYYMLHYVDGSLLYNEFSVYDYYPE